MLRRSAYLAAWLLSWLITNGYAGAQTSTKELADLSLEQLLGTKITSASLHEERLEDAPASVTVISADEIRRFGYRTLAEALAYVRGIYIDSDHTYVSAGIRGFSLPGFETRYIVLLNGHNIAENISEATFVGADFPLDMDLVERIEVVRGASSALYGSSGMLATINVVTTNPRRRAASACVSKPTAWAGERLMPMHRSPCRTALICWYRPPYSTTPAPINFTSAN